MSLFLCVFVIVGTRKMTNHERVAVYRGVIITLSEVIHVCVLLSSMRLEESCLQSGEGEAPHLTVQSGSLNIIIIRFVVK